MARILIVAPEKPDPTAIAEAARLIRGGQVVAFPTETVYGLGANAFNAGAVARIFAAKGRPASDPVIVHVAMREMLRDVAAVVPPLAHMLIENLWPGPLTLVLPRGSRIPPNVSAGLPTVAVRMPSHPVALALIHASGVPIAAPSANPFSRTSPTTAAHVEAGLGERIPLILDGGPTDVGVESTILDLSGKTPTVLRFGGVSLEVLRQVAPDLAIGIRMQGNIETAMSAPGMLIKHYAPRAPLTLYAGTSAAVCQELLSTALNLVSMGETVGLLIADEDRPALVELTENPLIQIRSLGSLNDLEGVARRLYAGLHELDGTGVSFLLARTFPDRDMGRAINDRLLRAASGAIRYID